MRYAIAYTFAFNPLMISGDGRARCNYATNEWEEVPRCIDAPPRGKGIAVYYEHFLVHC